MLDDRERRELAEMERRLYAEDTERGLSFALRSSWRPWSRRPVAAVTAGAALVLLSALLLGGALTVVLVVGIALMTWVLEADHAGADRRRRHDAG